jgi:predicted ATP-dependent protease
VEEAITRRQERLSLSSDKILELYEQGTLFVDVDGTRAGQVNGLAVFQLSGFSFGKPLRFTAATFAGRGGVVNIEREAKMAGPLFNKATLIISGYLRNRFAREKALSLNISLAVEQSYGGIEGDSASIAEVYAVLSAIAGAKVFQGVAVTGSMNQMGDVQPIGGVNEKIEGFFEVCKLRGLTGRQGVIIPRANVQNLMLRREVVEAVEQGRFHVWGIDRVEQGVPLLFGLEAGQAGPEGKYPEGTLFAACASAIAALAPRKPAKVARDRRAGDEDVAPDADEE